MAVGVFSPLRKRIYLDENGKISPTPGPDVENWRQCWRCGDIVGVNEAKQEAQLSSIAEPDNSPLHSIGLEA